MRRLAVLAIVLALSGCSSADREWPPDRSACRGEGEPIDERTLERTLARFGFTLAKEESCRRGVPGPAAEYTNIPHTVWDTATADVIFASQSQVWCVLLHEPRWSGEVWRRRVGEEVVFRLLNTECSIYESNPWHIEWLGRAFSVLRIEAS